MEHAAKPRDVASLLAIGAAWLIALSLEVPGLNGPDYWRWPWRSLDVVNVLAPFAGPLLMYALLAWYWSRTLQLRAAQAHGVVFGLVVCQALFQWSGLRAEPGGWQWLDDVVRSRIITSYYTDATRISDVASFLRDYSWRPLEHHTSTHPPGPVLFYWACIQLFGPDDAARVGGALVGLTASAGVAVAYWFAALWTDDPSRRLGVCFLYALLPALVVFLPAFDLIYPLFTMGSLIVWRRSFTAPHTAVALGLLLFAATMMAYQCLTLAAPLLLYALVVLRARGWDATLRRSMQRAAVVAVAAWLGAYALVWALSAFQPLDSFTAAIVRQQQYAELLQRPYWQCLVFDLYDFVLGSGLLALPLVGLYFARGRELPFERAIALAGLASIVVIDLTGLLRCETSRVWLFLQPLLIAPAGLSLASLGARARGLVLSLQALILIGIKCKLSFMYVP